MINKAKTSPITQKERLKSSNITVLFVKVKVYPIEERQNECQTKGQQTRLLVLLPHPVANL